MIVGDQVQLYFYRATDTSISLTFLLNLLYIYIYGLSWALARRGESVGDSPKSPSDWVLITSLEYYLIWAYEHTLDPFSGSNDI